MLGQAAQGLKKPSTVAAQARSSSAVAPPEKAIDKENVKVIRQPLKAIELRKKEEEEEEESEEEEEEENLDGGEQSSSSEEEGDGYEEEESRASTYSNDDDMSNLACEEEMEEEEEAQGGSESSEEESVQLLTKGKRKLGSLKGSRGGGAAKKARRSNNRRSSVTRLPTIHPTHPADAHDRDDPLKVVDYVEDIYLNMKEKEVSLIPSSHATEYSQLMKGILSVCMAVVHGWMTTADTHGQALHAHAEGHQREDEGHPGRLASRGAPQIQASATNAVSHRQSA